MTGRSRYVPAVVVALVGVVWLLQGVGVLPGSFMSGDITWAVIGVGLIIAGGAYAAWPTFRRR